MRHADHEIRLNREMMHSGHLILVNRDYPVAEHHQASLVPIATIQQAGTEEQDIRLDQTGYRQLSALLEACQAIDSIGIVSGYRTRAQQQHIYSTSLAAHGAAFTANYVARPNESEHQTGLAVDVGQLLEEDVDYLCPSFPDHGVYALFKQKAAEYGFIQRYKEGKQPVTNIACEPWHYRYVGVPHSIIMEQYDMCLEEYIAYMEQFTFEGSHLYMKIKNRLIEMYMIKAEHDVTLIPIRRGSCYEWSGNNKDGFIVTICHDHEKGFQ
ncbi:D-alanyl-D-alanine carboxypeptidase family protein [Paenibacillus mendelii]|uniref:D-alanyl-D-alanine carboxypeptidase family protein n=1 Tax=Paenibacillus mendelii TaxID=206163 RepID=A0ABV6JL46_9BACL|nr:D-alanyl-D-alanine carboxypeptidase family protein [Paenibacillus mendelii]MCQ6562352.1 D-alanyl-D-alanine carboxypeptidase family protein [Paenibacillus mendelii]